MAESNNVPEEQERTCCAVDCGSETEKSPRFKRFELQALRNRAMSAIKDGLGLGELARAYMALHDALDYLDAYQARLELGQDRPPDWDDDKVLHRKGLD